MLSYVIFSLVSNTESSQSDPSATSQYRCNVTAGLPKSREYGNPGYLLFMGCVTFYDTRGHVLRLLFP